jgi:crotonobetainyl-CoA:carnitine CoA-transferase CaiB-like acyl-CoA transferase
MEKKSEMGLLLSPFKVLDLTEEKGHYFFSKILGELGASVTRLERAGTIRDFWWWAYNSNKELLYLDITREQDKVLQLVKGSDILVESFPPGYLDRLGLGYTNLKQANPGLIMTSITPFGQSGPYGEFKASDLELMALSGVSHGIGDPDRPPLRISFAQSDLITSAEAAVGTLIALCQRELTGEGQQIDVSAQESVHCMLENKVRKQGVLGSTTRIGGCHPVMPSGKPESDWKYHHTRHPQIWQCKDGHVAFLLHPYRVAPETNKTLVKYMEIDGDLPDYVRRINWDSFDWVDISPEEATQIWDTFARFFNRHTYNELYQIALKESIQLFPGNTVKDLLADGQLAARQYWQEQKIPDLGKTLKVPGPFAQVQLSPPASSPEVKKTAKLPCLPFEGVKILDFTWVVTGPWMTQWLALYGAEVVKIESSKTGTSGRRSRGRDFGFVGWNSAKKSLTLNLKHPRSQELARQLVAWADVVVENFSPGTMKRMGFGYDELLKINPRIIMFSASMMGATGPYAAQPGLGQILSTLSGFTELTGWPDRLPVTAHGPYTDVISCRMGAATLFAALDYQRRTGHGCCIDMSQFEGSLHFLTPLILQYQANGTLLHRMGNRSLTDSPHGVFPCQGDDRWCALSVSNDTEWQAFCQVLGRPEWVNDPRFASFEQRKQNEDELEELISEWTIQLRPEEVMAELQKAGVKAGLVEGPDDLLKDPQLNYRNHFVTVKHAELGEYDYVDSGFRLEKAPPDIKPAPLFGEHTEYVCKQILGLSDEEYNSCLNDGAFV